MVSRNYASDFQIDFSVSPVWFRAIRTIVTSSSMHCGFDERTAGQIAMAVDEALSNILRHGYKEDQTGRVALHVLAAIEPSPHITIQLDDEAPHVDIGSISPRDLDEIRPGGLGLHLIHSIMDDVQWSKLSSGGTRLIMNKRCDTNMTTS